MVEQGSSTTSGEALVKLIRQGADALGLDLTKSQLEQLSDFLGLLQKWNKVYNLTSIRNPEAMLQLHLLDSMAAVQPLRRHLASLPQSPDVRPRLLDVGSGGGLPGVIFAICMPGLSVDCVDAVGKKAAFVQQVAAVLRLPHLRGLHARVEALDGSYDVVSSRAFASLEDFTNGSAKVVDDAAVWLAMKGRPPQDEIAALPEQVKVFHVEPLSVPGLDAERCIVWMRRIRSAVASDAASTLT